MLIIIQKAKMMNNRSGIIVSAGKPCIRPDAQC